MAHEIHDDACSICVGNIDGISIVEVAGEVDIATVSLLAKALDDAVHSAKGHVIIDAQQLTYIDSAGLQTLLSAHRNLRDGGRSMLIVGCHGIFYRLMKISQLARYFNLFASMDEAMAHLQRA